MPCGILDALEMVWAWIGDELIHAANIYSAASTEFSTGTIVVGYLRSERNARVQGTKCYLIT
jgi:hypothetical protein